MDRSVQTGKTVCLQYTLSLANGTLVDSSTASGTWTYVHGHTRMPAGLTKGVEGLKAAGEGLKNEELKADLAEKVAQHGRMEQYYLDGAERRAKVLGKPAADFETT